MPLRVSEDRWQFNGCPENGPALAVDASQRIHAVWPTVVNTQGKADLALFYATSRDGRSFGSRVRIPTGGAAYHPQIAAAADGSIVIAWDQVVDGVRRVAAVRAVAKDSGGIRFDALPLGDTAGLYPAIATTPTHDLIAWTRRDAAGGSTLALARFAR
jgi:hypothetical protein